MRKVVLIVLIVIAFLTLMFWWRSGQVEAPAKKPASATSKAPEKTEFNKTAYSTDDPESPWVIVNKQRPINPLSFKPNDLRQPNVAVRVPGAAEMQLRSEAATALEKMFAAAATEGINVQVSTAYRGYAFQKTLYDGYVESEGQDTADTVSARPGYSEHQTGWAADIRNATDTCGLQACFGTTPEGKWLAANAHTFGYHLRYPSGKEAVTGYNYEPWHFRYVGTVLTQELLRTNTATLEEFFKVDGGSEY